VDALKWDGDGLGEQFTTLQWGAGRG